MVESLDRAAKMGNEDRLTPKSQLTRVSTGAMAISWMEERHDDGLRGVSWSRNCEKRIMGPQVSRRTRDRIDDASVGDRTHAKRDVALRGL